MTDICFDCKFQRVSNLFEGVTVYFQGYTETDSSFGLKQEVLKHGGKIRWEFAMVNYGVFFNNFWKETIPLKTVLFRLEFLLLTFGWLLFGLSTFFDFDRWLSYFSGYLSFTKVTHIVCRQLSNSGRKAFFERTGSKSVFAVTPQWIIESIRQKKRLPESQFASIQDKVIIPNKSTLKFLWEWLNAEIDKELLFNWDWSSHFEFISCLWLIVLLLTLSLKEDK